MRTIEQPTIAAWRSRVGLVEEYEYPRGRAAAGAVHVHGELQICLSLDFPGRYAYRGAIHDVPVGSVSIVDAWEPHATSDPCDRDRLSHYVVIYVDPVGFRQVADRPATVGIGTPIHTDASIVHGFRALYRALSSDDAVLEQEERYQALAHAVIGDDDGRVARQPASRALQRARDFIAAHATERVSLADVAAHADLSPWHLTRAFRRRFGVPPHRFQMAMRIDRARRLLAARRPTDEIAYDMGFADEPHFIRWFKRLVHTTPGQYRMPRRSRDTQLSGFDDGEAARARAISGRRRFPS